MSTLTTDAGTTTRWGLPGVRFVGAVTEPRPDRLLTEGPLLLAGAQPDRAVGWEEHMQRYGPMPALDLDTLVSRTEGASLRGYGGAAFPTAVKLRSVAGSRQPLVIVNAMEGEHASAKDGTLLRHIPHLVLDGALVAAAALGASGITVRVADDRPGVVDAVRSAASRRGAAHRVAISVGPAAFAAGEATAVVNGVVGRTPLPEPLGLPPRAPGPGRMRSLVPALARTALVSNVETFARLGLVARGMRADSALLTISGAVRHRGVLELSSDASLADAVAAAGGLSEPARVVATGGWHGRWVPWDVAETATLSRAGMDAVGGRWGAGVFVVVAASVCPIAVVAAVAATLGAGSAGQCGPCRDGLPVLAERIWGLSRSAHPRAVTDVQAMLGSLRGRGMCAHPTASVDALGSTLELVTDDLVQHAHGRCLASFGWPV